MKTILSVLVLAALTFPAYAGNLGHFLGGVADSRDGRYDRDRYDRIERETERFNRQLQLQQLQRQIEENNRMMREMESREFRQKYGIKPY